MTSATIRKCIQLYMAFQYLLLFASANFEIEIGAEDQLDEIGASTTCIYKHELTEFCKRGFPDNTDSGFWSSCDTDACEIRIPFNRLGNDPPTQVTFLTYVYGGNSQIRLRYRLTPLSQTLNLRPDLPSSSDWTTSTYDLSTISGLSNESELLIILSSGPLPVNVDIVDSIIFTLPGEPTTNGNPDQTTSLPLEE